MSRRTKIKITEDSWLKITQNKMVGGNLVNQLMKSGNGKHKFSHYKNSFKSNLLLKAK